MGGSGGGGGGWSGVPPDELANQIRRAQQGSLSAAYDTECNGYIASLLPSINNRDIDAINRYLVQIGDALHRKLEGDLELLLGGSVSRHTWVDGLSDVDSLVLVDDSELADATPEHVRGHIADRLRARFRDVPIEVGRLAVTLNFPDVTVQLLPALRRGEGICIPDASGHTWSAINPRAFASILTKVNQQQGGKVVPTIKLVKSLLAAFPDGQRLSGYHVESMAVEVFRNYEGVRTLRAMVRQFFEQAAQRVLKPIVDRTGQSVHVDDDLGAPNSQPRLLRAAALGRVARQLANADASEDLGTWKNLLEP